ncbi:heme utilization or adhesion protein [[Actinobacillus] rossii]|uniref:Heme utilization or adhesion protein n=1 Tax=[Actinobacillus] rossii TaxID=123820 RepID=A0A380U6B5_9PAST|nr:heme utilization or adhesion protein [[Actinobacillus] rossii]
MYGEYEISELKKNRRERTLSQTAEDNGNNRFETGTLSYSDIRNHADYSGSGFGVGGGFSMGGGDKPKEIGGMKLTSFGQNAMVETVNADGTKTTTLEGQMNINKSVGFGYDSEHNDSVTKSGINTVNIQIRDENGQIKKTGQTVMVVKQVLQQAILIQKISKLLKVMPLKTKQKLPS